MEEADRLWAAVDDQDVLWFKQLFGEVVSAKRFERMVKEIELKVWVYNLMLDLGPGSLRRGILTGGRVSDEAEGRSWNKLLNKALGP